MTNVTRTSIFETLNAGLSSSKMERDRYTAQQVISQLENNDSCISDIVEDNPFSTMDVDVEDVTDETSATLWLSCSPGRESSSDFEPSIEGHQEIVKDKQKKFKAIKKSKEKPLSAYGMFFNSTQNSIIKDHPNASFNEISEITAKLWDNLPPRDKQLYFEKANLAAQKHHSGDHKKKHKTKSTSLKTKVDSGGTADLLGACKREGCSNRAVVDSQWMQDFCSSQCVVTYCKETFRSWVAKQKSASPSHAISLD